MSFPDNNNNYTHLLLLREAALLEQQRQNATRTTYTPRPSQTDQKTQDTWRQYLPDVINEFRDSEQCDRIWVHLKGVTIGLAAFSFGYYLSNSNKTA